MHDRYRQLFEESTAVQLIVNADGARIVEANQAAADFYGRDRGSLRDSTIDALAAAEPLTLRSALDTARDVGVHLANIPQRHASGETRLVDVYATPIAADGALVHLIVHDVTERARAEERERLLHAEQVARGLTEQAAREWQGTFDAIEQPIVICAPDGSVVRANAAAGALAGLDPGTIAHMPLRLLAPRALWQAAADHLTVAVEHGVAGAARVRDERRRTWEIVATRFVPPGSVEPRVIVVARELTALIALQDELQRQETLSRMGELVAGVAHEVRNPLFAISSALDTLIARLAGNPDFVRYAPVLQQQVGRLSHLMQDLLDYGKPPALILRDVAVADIVNDAVQLTRSLAGERQVAVVPQVLVAAGTTARVDRERIAQVFQNLLANAIQHSPAQATIELTARLGALADGEWLEVVTCDQGGGFDVDDLPHLFEPFFSRRPGGTGLGLALAHRVVHDHGGTLVAENRSTGGAMVTVRLPIDATPRN